MNDSYKIRVKNPGDGPDKGVKPGRVIQTLRDAAGMTQLQLAEATGLHVNTIIYIEGGRVMPKVDTFATLMDALGYSWVFMPQMEIIDKHAKKIV